MDFFIAKGSTLPKLKMKLIMDSDFDYDKFNEMVEDAAITFSMVDVDTKVFKIANKAGKIHVQKNDRSSDCNVGLGDDLQYYIIYEFTEKDTSKTGTFLGEFKVDFMGDYCKSLIVPIKEKLYIHIQDSITKTTKINI